MVHRCSFGILIAALTWAAASTAPGQIAEMRVGAAVNAPATDGDSAEQAPTGFSIRKEDKRQLDAIDDFARYAQKKAWDRAFGVMGTLLEADLKAMAPAGDGFFIPSKDRLRQILASLPADGKQAYRLFNDARARQLLEQAKGDREIANLRKICDQYFITSVGDIAANRLGDAQYEAGDFAGAAESYQAILRDFPDTSLSRPRLEVKRALALSRAGQTVQAKEAVARVRREYAGEQVTLAGKSVDAADFLTAALARPQTQPASATQPAADDAGPIALPPTETPSWQADFLDEHLQSQMQQAVASTGWNQLMGSLLSYVPPTDDDGKRIFLNYMGVVLALDLQTGKLLWRTRKFSELGEKFQQFVYSSGDLDRYSTVAAGNNVLVTGVNLDRLNYGMEPVRLVCLAADTGAVRWSSATGGGVGLIGAIIGNGEGGAWSVAGPPAVADEKVYYIGHAVSGQDMTLAVLSLDKGAPLWTLPLGSAQAMGTSWRGTPNFPVPVLKVFGDTVYVLTNNGALLAIDSAGRRIKWGFTYNVPGLLDTDEHDNGYGQIGSTAVPGQILFADGILYCKETNGRELFAIDPSGPKLLWRRPLSPDETIAAIDGQKLYLQGAGAGMIDLADRALKWSAQLPSDLAVARPMLGGDSLFVFAPGGVFQLSLNTGDAQRIFRGGDRDSAGGAVRRVGQSLLTISSQRITSYRLSAEAGRSQ